jgi:penicillin-binding protein 1C
MLKEYGYQRFYKLLKEMGMTTLFRHADDYGLTLILGGAEGTLWDITSLYSSLSAIAQERAPQKPRLLQNTKTERLKAPRALSAGGAFLTLDALIDVERPGVEGYWKSFARSQKVAWKTGTSLGHRDAWAVGVTPDYTVGVWCGNADGEGKPGMSGLVAAAPALFEIFSTLDNTRWFDPPLSKLKRVELCKHSGYLPTENCETETVMLPDSSNFSKTCPYHRVLHLDKSESVQVTSSCVPVSEMVHKTWFVLSPVEEYYYTRVKSDYRKPPPFRDDCRIEPSYSPMSMVYPTPRTILYIPVDIDGNKSEVVFKAVHTDDKRTIFWHLDEEYLGKTEHFHEISARPQPGRHKLTLVDDHGNRIYRYFTVK